MCRCFAFLLVAALYLCFVIFLLISDLKFEIRTIQCSVYCLLFAVYCFSSSTAGNSYCWPFTHHYSVGDQIMQPASARSEGDGQKPQTQGNKRKRITYEVPEQSPSNSDCRSIRPQNAQTGGPLADRESCQTGKDSEIQQGRDDCQNNAGSFRRTAP